MSMEATLRIETLGLADKVPFEIFDEELSVMFREISAEGDEDEEENGASYGDILPYCFEAVENLARNAAVTPLSAYSTNEWYLEKEIEATLGEEPDEDEEEALLNRIGDWFPAVDGLSTLDAMLSVLASDPQAAGRYRCEKSYLGLRVLTWDLRAMRCLLADAAEKGRRFRILIS